MRPFNQFTGLAFWGLLACAIACGVKAPPRPPLPQNQSAADGGQPNSQTADPAKTNGTCNQADGGCGP